MYKAAGLISAILLTGCQAFSPETSKLDESEWRVVEIDGQPVAPGVRSTLRLSDGRVAGSTGCNQYSAEATVEGKTLEIGQAVSTRRACESAAMNQERRFLGVLQGSHRYELAGNELSLLNADGRVRMQLVRLVP